jgi:hypothetical protein
MAQPTNSGGNVSAPNRAPAAKVIAGALANNRVAQALITALGNRYINAIVATSTSQTTNFGSLLVGDLVLHVGAAPAPSLLGVAATYAALAYSAVTGSTGAGAGSTLNGNIGIYPTAATGITNFPPSTFSGAENANASAGVAQAAAQAAYTAIQAMPAGTTEGALDGLTLTPGTYTSGSAMSLTGTLTLNGAGNYYFQMVSTLTTAAGATIVLTNGATANNVYFAVGSSATLGATNTFNGNILADASITVGGGTVNGSLIALTGAVTYSATTTSNAASSSSSGNVTFTTIATAGNLGYAATVGDMYLALSLVNLDANNPIIPPPPATLTGRYTGDGGLDF